MEREANYAAVGAFVLLVVAMAALFIYWYSDSGEHRHYTRYEIYFDGSVSGLTRGGSVRYLGVDIGRVMQMRVDPRNAGRVQIIVDIDSSTPITAHTAAELALQGVTGVLYIDLMQSVPAGRLLPNVPSEEYPVIRSAHSDFDVLISGLPEIVAVASVTLERVDRVLSDANLAALSRSIGNLDRASAALPDTLREMRALLADVRGTSDELRATAASVHAITQESGPRLSSAVDHMSAVATHLADATARLDRLIAENSADVRSFTRDSLPELERFLHDGRDATAEIRDLAHSLRENPSALLYQPPPQGVRVPP
ncbi:MAG TPA: MlaD family protein [Steroidobacteraceae bacterium]|nr:MlaD family protein [Steroidobacteraceae bacterium]